MGLCSGRSYFFAPLPKAPDVNSDDIPIQHLRAVSVHPLPLDDANKLEEKKIATSVAGTSNFSGSTSSKEQPIQQTLVHTPEQPIKRRKRHRRKHHQNQEQCVMRGVYFKNMKWQAAIKVDKKQIHLGTVGSQVEAAHLYDRAAFMCGREPNFELSEEEKQELRKLDWEEFLALTRHAITHKKHKRARRPEPLVMPDTSDWEGEQGANSLSASDEMDQEGTSLSS